MAFSITIGNCRDQQELCVLAAWIFVDFSNSKRRCSWRNHHRHFVRAPTSNRTNSRYVQPIMIKKYHHQNSDLIILSIFVVQSAYREALGHLQGDNPLVAPQFKTWLYIYRNNTVEESFRTSARDNFFVEVKDIDRIDYSDLTDEVQPDPDEKPTTAVIDQETVVAPISEINIDNAKKPVEIGATVSESLENSKDIPDFETLKIKNPIDDDETRIIDDQKDASKFDEVVEDKQYVEVPVIREAISKEKERLVEQAKQAIVADNNQYVANSVVTAEGIKAIREELKETVRERKGSLDSLEIMEAQESHFSGRQVSYDNALIKARNKFAQSLLSMKLINE